MPLEYNLHHVEPSEDLGELTQKALNKRVKKLKATIKKDKYPKTPKYSPSEIKEFERFYELDFAVRKHESNILTIFLSEPLWRCEEKMVFIDHTYPMWGIKK